MTNERIKKQVIEARAKNEDLCSELDNIKQQVRIQPPEEAAPGPENLSHEEAKSYDVNFYQENPVAEDPPSNEGPDSPKFGGESDPDQDEKVDETYEITFPEQYHNSSSANTTV